MGSHAPARDSGLALVTSWTVWQEVDITGLLSYQRPYSYAGENWPRCKGSTYAETTCREEAHTGPAGTHTQPAPAVPGSDMGEKTPWVFGEDKLRFFLPEERKTQFFPAMPFFPLCVPFPLTENTPLLTLLVTKRVEGFPHTRQFSDTRWMSHSLTQ